MRRRSSPWPAFVDLFSALLVFTFAALIFSSDSTPPHEPTNEEILKRTNDSLTIENAQLRDSLRVLRSRIKPACRELGVATGFLFEVVVLGAGTYEFHGSPLDLAMLYEQFRSDIDRADSAQCVHQVRAVVGPDVSGREYANGLEALRRTFYVAPGTGH